MKMTKHNYRQPIGTIRLRMLNCECHLMASEKFHPWTRVYENFVKISLTLSLLE
jgi:hypothetical protein